MKEHIKSYTRDELLTRVIKQIWRIDGILESTKLDVRNNEEVQANKPDCV